MTTRDAHNDGSRFWVVDSHEYGVSQPHGFVPDEYVGLVDENQGGIVAFGSRANIERLEDLLNRLEPTTTNRSIYRPQPTFRDAIRFARGLIDGPLDNNSEYARGIVELIVDTFAVEEGMEGGREFVEGLIGGKTMPRHLPIIEVYPKVLATEEVL
jgi:hypothetical protein